MVGLIVYTISTLFLVNLATSLLLVLIIGGVTGILYLSLYWLFNFFEPEDIDSIKLFARRMFGKI